MKWPLVWRWKFEDLRVEADASQTKFNWQREESEKLITALKGVIDAQNSEEALKIAYAAVYGSPVEDSGTIRLLNMSEQDRKHWGF